MIIPEQFSRYHEIKKGGKTMSPNTNYGDFRSRVVEILGIDLSSAVCAVPLKEISLVHLKKNKKKIREEFALLIKKYSEEQEKKVNKNKMVEVTGISEEEINRAESLYNHNQVPEVKTLGEALKKHRDAVQKKDWIAVGKAIIQASKFFME